MDTKELVKEYMKKRIDEEVGWNKWYAHWTDPKAGGDRTADMEMIINDAVEEALRVLDEVFERRIGAMARSSTYEVTPEEQEFLDLLERLPQALSDHLFEWWDITLREAVFEKRMTQERLVELVKSVTEALKQLLDK